MLDTLEYRLAVRFIKSALTHPAQAYNIDANITEPFRPLDYLFSREVSEHIYNYFNRSDIHFITIFTDVLV